MATVPTFPAVAPERSDMTAVRALLDQALLGLRGIADPKVKLRDAEREVAAALLHTYRALASPGDASAFDGETKSALQRSRAALAALQEVDTTDRGTESELAVVAEVVRLLARNPAAPDLAPELPREGRWVPVLLATTGEPRLLELDRSVLYPTVPLVPLPDEEASADAVPSPAPPELATDEDIAALLAKAEAAIGIMDAAEKEAEEKEAADEEPPVKLPLGPPDDAALEREYLGIQLEEREVILQRARASFDDLAAFGMMRTPQADEGWSSGERVERRLFSRVDAIVACGTWVLPRLVKMLEELPIPDPDMTWGSVMLFGSLAGDDSLDQALRIAKASDLEVPDMMSRIADAFALAPHPGVEAAMRTWQSDREPGRRAIAVSALGRRRVLAADDAVRATVDPDPRVVLAGAEALALAVGEVPGRAFEPLLQGEDPVFVRAAMASATARGTRQGVARAIELTAEARGDFADAVMFVAIGAGAETLDTLHEDRAASGSDVHLEALGWFGDLQCVDYVLGRMRTGEPTTQVVCLETLQMLTGANLTKTNPEPRYPEDGLPFTVPDAMPEDVGPLLLDPEPWAAWWQRHRGNAQPRTRYRFGHPWTPRDNLWQMENPESRTRARVFAHLELVARMGGAIPFDVRDFVVVQRRRLAEWRELVEARAGRAPAGSWATSYVRS